MTCGIYKIENKINGKVYIGQSVDIERRWNEHKSRSLSKKHDKDYNMKIYKAIRKYGLNNFKLSIIEECSEDKLRDKEIYWINYYNSMDSNFGYNTANGYIPTHFRKLYDNEYNNLCEDLKNNLLSLDDISKKYNVSLGYIYEVNRGDNFRKNEDENYPLRKDNIKNRLSENEITEIKNDLLKGLPLIQIRNKYNICEMDLYRINYGLRHAKKDEKYPLHDYASDKIFSEEEKNEIINLISNTKMSFVEIGKIYNKSASAIECINSGNSFYDKNIQYPIRKNKKNFLTENDINDIYDLLLNSSLSLEEIRNKYNIGKITLYYINTGYTHKKDGYQYPLRK